MGRITSSSVPARFPVMSRIVASRPAGAWTPRRRRRSLLPAARNVAVDGGDGGERRGQVAGQLGEGGQFLGPPGGEIVSAVGQADDPDVSGRDGLSRQGL